MEKVACGLSLWEELKKWGKVRDLRIPRRVVTFLAGWLCFSWWSLSGASWLARAGSSWKVFRVQGKGGLKMAEGGSVSSSRFSELDDLNLGEINGVIFRQFTIPSEPCGSRVLSSCQLRTHVRNTNCKGGEESQRASRLIIPNYHFMAWWVKILAPHSCTLPSFPTAPLSPSHGGWITFALTFWGRW